LVLISKLISKEWIFLCCVIFKELETFSGVIFKEMLFFSKLKFCNFACKPRFSAKTEPVTDAFR